MARPRLDERSRSVDTHIGAKVKARRLVLGLSQEELARQIGLSFQQVQKYESGMNRISASRLLDICSALGVPHGYFLDDEKVLAASARRDESKKDRAGGCRDTTLDPEFMSRKDVVELVRNYCLIQSPQFKKELLKMLKTMAETKS